MHLRENIPYDKRKDEYTCPSGRKLQAVYTGKRKSKSGFEREVTWYECESCEGCALKKQCTRAKGNRNEPAQGFSASAGGIQAAYHITARDFTENEPLHSGGGRLWRSQAGHGLPAIPYTRKKNVFTEMLLLAIGYNLNKWHNKKKNNRNGSQLFEKLSA